MHEVHRIALSRRFRARLCSTAALLHVVLFLLTLLLSLLFAFRTHESRFETVQVTEQPTVLYQQQFLIVLTSATSGRYWLWSSSLATNQRERDHLKPSLIRFCVKDYNNDGRPDSFRLIAVFPLAEGEVVYGINALFAFDYSIAERSAVELQAIAHVQHESSHPGLEYRVTGEMKAVQKTPVKLRSPGDTYGQVIDFGKQGISYERLLDLLSRSNNRNLSITFVPHFSKWSEKPANTTADFTLHIKINYLEDTFLHHSCFYEVLKWGWIQFYAVFVILFYIYSCCQSFVFENRLVAVEEESDLAYLKK